MELARRASLKVMYSGTDISKYINNQISSFSYVDCAKGEADTIDITLSDENNQWINNNMLNKYDHIYAEINTLNWNKFGETQRLNCGDFLIDEPSFSGPPDTVVIQAISKPSNSNFTETKNSKVWINATVEEIANEIAKRNGLKLFYDADRITVGTSEQSENSDMSYLTELTETYGLAFKLTDKTIVIFSEKQYESKPAVYTVVKNKKDTISYDFKSQLTNTAYDSCKITYIDADGTYKEYKYSIYEPKDNEELKEYKINTIAKSYAEAEILVMSKLRQLNKKEVSGSITLIGNVSLVGGVNVNVSGFGKFDGKYFVDRAIHELPNYNTTIEVHKCLEGY